MGPKYIAAYCCAQFLIKWCAVTRCLMTETQSEDPHAPTGVCLDLSFRAAPGTWSVRTRINRARVGPEAVLQGRLLALAHATWN